MQPADTPRQPLLICALAVSFAGPLGAQPSYDSTVVTVAGQGPTTVVLISGIVGGVAGFRRLRTHLLDHGHRVISIDPYRLSVDSADVTFAALARRVDVVLRTYGIDTARVVGHAHGAGVALRLAANHPGRVGALYFLDVGALPANRTKVFSASLKLVPLIVRVPGGRRLVRARFVHGLRQNAGYQNWLDSVTQREYTQSLLEHASQVVAMAGRLARAREPEPLGVVVSRVRVPVMLLIGDVPHPAGPDPGELTALAPLGRLVCAERLPGVGHFPHEEIPRHVAQRLTSPATWGVSPQPPTCSPLSGSHVAKQAGPRS